MSLVGFVREAWHVLEPNSAYAHGWHIEAICDHLEAITAGRLNRLLINVPPGMMKSLLVSVFWPAWEWGPRGLASLRYLASSYSENYVKRDSRRMRDLVASEWYQALWGDKVRLVRAGELSFANEATGFREGVPFPSLTGGVGVGVQAGVAIVSSSTTRIQQRLRSRKPNGRARPVFFGSRCRHA